VLELALASPKYGGENEEVRLNILLGTQNPANMHEQSAHASLRNQLQNKIVRRLNEGEN
jgi:hypothetical protein